jgi:hypothetical protein
VKLQILKPFRLSLGEKSVEDYFPMSQIKGMILKVKIKILYPLISGSPLINFCQGQIKAREMLVQEGQTERAIVSFEFIYYFRT